jgi:putative MATE family efflux protein
MKSGTIEGRKITSTSCRHRMTSKGVIKRSVGLSVFTQIEGCLYDTFLFCGMLLKYVNEGGDCVEQSMKKDFFKYVSLNMLGMIGMSCYILADTYFIAQALGSSGIAALNLSIPLFGLIHGIGLMIGLGGGTRFAIVRAKRELKQAHNTFSQSVLFAGLFGGLFLLIGVPFARQLASLMGANSETIRETTIYLRTLFSFAPFFILNNVLQAFVRNDGNPSLSMKAMMIGSLLNIVLDYIFIFPLNMGMFGAALATSVSPIIGLLVLSAHFQNIFHQLQFKWQKLRIASFLDISYLGASGLINELSSAVVMFTFNTLIFYLAGNHGLAAYGIVANISFVVIALFVGIAQGAQPLFSHSFGKEDKEGLKIVMRLALITSTVLSVIIYSVTFFGAEWIANVFNSEGILSISEMATIGLRIYFVGFLFAGANIVYTSYFAAIAEAKASLFFSVIRGGVILLPTVLLFSQLWEMTGIWFSFVVAEALVLLWILVHIAVRKKRIKSINEKNTSY